MTNRELHNIVVTHMNRQAQRISRQLRDTRNAGKLEEIKFEMKGALEALGELVKNANEVQGVEQGGLFNTAEYEKPRDSRIRGY